MANQHASVSGPAALEIKLDVADADPAAYVLAAAAAAVERNTPVVEESSS